MVLAKMEGATVTGSRQTVEVLPLYLPYGSTIAETEGTEMDSE
jgi:hypothetical protein